MAQMLKIRVGVIERLGFISDSPGDPISEIGSDEEGFGQDSVKRFHSLEQCASVRWQHSRRYRPNGYNLVGQAGRTNSGPQAGTYGKYGSQQAFSVEGTFIVPNPQLQIGTVISMPFEENSYIAHLSGQNDCIVFDPGFEPDAIVEYLEQNSLVPSAIVCTHGHSDHIAGNAEMKRRWPE